MFVDFEDLGDALPEGDSEGSPETLVVALRGCDSAEAWALRESLAAIWPAAVARSLAGLAGTPRGSALLFRLLANARGDLALLREAARVLDPTASGPRAG